jgi:hypothetical protein
MWQLQVLNQTIPSVIARLYDDAKFQCSETGIRFATKQEYDEYLDLQSTEKRRKRDIMSFRYWFPIMQDFVTNFAAANNEINPAAIDLFSENNKDAKGDGELTEAKAAERDAARVSAKLAPTGHCVMCEEKFDTLYDNDKGEWVVTDAHTLDIEGKTYVLKTSCFKSVTAAVEAKKGRPLSGREMMELIGAGDPSTPRGKRLAATTTSLGDHGKKLEYVEAPTSGIQGSSSKIDTTMSLALHDGGAKEDSTNSVEASHGTKFEDELSDAINKRSATALFAGISEKDMSEDAQSAGQDVNGAEPAKKKKRGRF